MTDFPTSFVALLPSIFIAATIVAVVLLIAFRRQHLSIATLTGIGLAAALLSLIGVLQVTPVQVTPLFLIDDYAVLFSALVLVAALVCTRLAHAYLETMDEQRREEFYVLLLCSTLGAIALVSSRHLASLFIGLELLSVPLYGMIAYALRERVSLEGALKYMVLSGVASSFLLFGMALLYGASGTMAFSGLASAMAQGGALHNWVDMGVGMMIVGLAFKLSLVPFHLWTPDVYEGAPAPAAMFLATVSKVAVFAVLMRFFVLAPAASNALLHTLLAVIAFLSMLLGNLLALRQNNIKRLLGYSSIAHLGYLLTAVVAGGELGVETMGVYLTTYVVTTLGAFGVVTLVSTPCDDGDAADLAHYRGLFWRRPYLAAVMTIMMLSLAGIPLTVGFIGKFYAITVAVQSDLWWLVAALVVGSGIGLYYYLRVMITLYKDAPEDSGSPAPATSTSSEAAMNQSGDVLMLVLAIVVLFLGVFPQSMISMVNAAVIGGG